MNNLPNSYTLILDESVVELEGSPQKYVVGGGLLFNHSITTFGEIKKLAQEANPSKKPFHWTDRGRTRRLEMLDLAAHHALTPIAVINTCKPKDQEEARFQCLVRLLQITQSYDIQNILLETREASLRNNGQNRTDSRAITQCRQEGIHLQATYDWYRKSDPIGWLADAIAGSVSFNQRNTKIDDTAWFSHLKKISKPIIESIVQP